MGWRASGGCSCPGGAVGAAGRRRRSLFPPGVAHLARPAAGGGSSRPVLRAGGPGRAAEEAGARPGGANRRPGPVAMRAPTLPPLWELPWAPTRGGGGAAAGAEGRAGKVRTGRDPGDPRRPPPRAFPRGVTVGDGTEGVVEVGGAPGAKRVVVGGVEAGSTGPACLPGLGTSPSRVTVRAVCRVLVVFF